MKLVRLSFVIIKTSSLKGKALHKICNDFKVIKCILSYVNWLLDRIKDEVVVGRGVRIDGRFFNKTMNIVTLNTNNTAQGITVDCHTVENRCQDLYQESCLNENITFCTFGRHTFHVRFFCKRYVILQLFYRRYCKYTFKHISLLFQVT